MKRLSLSFALLSLGACATTQGVPPDEDAEFRVRPIADTCTTDAVGRFVGQRATQELGQQILEATDTRELRWVYPGIIVTADYKYGRVTVDYDENMIVQRVACG